MKTRIIGISLLCLFAAACGDAELVADTGTGNTGDTPTTMDESPTGDGTTTPADDTPDGDPTKTPDDEVTTANNNTPDEPPTQSGCQRTLSAGVSDVELEHDGMERSFRVYVPATLDPSSPAPVVLNFHGRSMTGSQQALLSQMDPVAEEKGFIAVYPEGTGSLEQTFNGGLCCGSAQTRRVDDVGFTAAMLDELESELCIDTDRVYAIGMSNGGFMAHRLGCELSDRITAIGGVAGTLGMFNCSPSRPVPVIHFHGTSDSVVPYDGFVGQVSVDNTVDTWRDNNGCSGGSDVYFDQGDVTCEAWTNCDAGSEVRLCTVDGGGHTWPGGTSSFIGALGKTTDNISATEHAWEFFQRFSF